MEQIMELVKELFTNPKQAMYRAREEDYRTATLALLGVALGLHLLLLLGLGVGFSFAAIAVILAFGALYIPVWFGGNMTGGTGSGMDIPQLCGLVYMPLAIVTTLLRVAGLGGGALLAKVAAASAV